MENNSRTNSNNPSPLIVGIFVIIIGLAFLILGIVITTDRNTKKKTYSTTVGKVVEEKGSGNTMPVYEYKVDGKTYRFMSTTKTRTQSKVGNEVIIYYNPSNPSLAFDNSNANNASLFTLLGAFFTLVGALLCTAITKKNTPTLRVIRGLIAGSIFTGFPIALMVMIPHLPIYIDIFFAFFIIGGAAIIISTFYGTFINKEFGEKTEENARKFEEFANNLRNKF